jgi:hypothetical protein
MSDITFPCTHCDQDVLIEEAARGCAVKCPMCGNDITVPQVGPVSPRPAASFWTSRMDSPGMPPAVAGGMKAFLMFGLLASLFGPILLLFLLSEKETGPLAISFVGVMMTWGILALITAYGIKSRRLWSRPLGFCLAIMLLCSLLVFIVAPPGLVGGLLTIIASISIVPSASMIFSLSKPDWKKWYAA